MKNGAPIPGATTARYTTPATIFADSGAVYSVTAIDSQESVTSSGATLTVTARAPQTGDLRFQQVDSPTTINGIPGGGEGTEFGAGIVALSFGDAIGTPLSVGPGCPAVGGSNGFECSWTIEASPLPIGFTGLSVYYSYQNFSTFNDSVLETALNQISTANAVVTGLDTEQASNLFAASWIKPTASTSAGDTDPWGPSDGTFDMAMNTVSSDSFQTAASQDGADGRVITAVSWNNGQITYLSYGWSNDSTTAYEVQTISATFSTVGAVAQQLAAGGYIITAVGGTVSDGLILVGTRVQGDTMPRPFLFEDVVTGGNLTLVANGGYAVVGFLVNLDSDGNALDYDWIGER
jgi:hypothetical protein